MGIDEATVLTLEQTASEIAGLVGGELQGEAGLMISGIKGLPEAGPKDLSYLDMAHAKYLAAAATTKAGCVLLPAANRQVACPAQARIYVPDTQYAITLVLYLLASRKPKPEGRAPS